MNKKRIIVLIIIILLLLPILYSLLTKNPKGTGIESEYYSASDVEFLYDLNYDNNGKRKFDGEIFKAQIELIAEAERFILIDFFLFNDIADEKIATFPKQTEILKNMLIEKKLKNPEIDIVFIQDPINSFYDEKNLFWANDEMEKNGIDVIVTDLDKLRDSNYIYSGYYRVFKPILNKLDKNFISNPLDVNGESVSIKEMSRLMNLKVNHRKIIVTDKEGIISSSNPHDASALHSNVAVRFKSDIINTIIKGESVISKFSEDKELDFEFNSVIPESDIKLKYLTEKSIYTSLKKYIDETQKNDTINMGIFYITEKNIIKALEKASKRGVEINIIADKNKGAFGIKKDGSPNKPVLTKLKESSPNINIRWYNTDFEQFHTKITQFIFNEKCVYILGSANYTKKNLRNYNLEADIEIVTNKNSNFTIDFNTYFNRLLENKDTTYTIDFNMYKDESKTKYIIHKLKEFTGMSTY